MKFKQLIFFTITLHSAFLSLSGMNSGVANMELGKSGTHKRKIATLGELRSDESRKYIKKTPFLSHTQYDEFHKDIVRLIRKAHKKELIQTLRSFSEQYPTEYLDFLKVISILHSLIKQKTLNYPLIQYLFKQPKFLEIQLNVKDSNGNSIEECIKKRNDRKLGEMFATATGRKNPIEEADLENLVINTPLLTCEEKIVCRWNGCLKEYTTRLDYRKHFRKQHKQEREAKDNKFHCKWIDKNGTPCTKAYSKKPSLNVHLNKHTGKFKCTHSGCNKVFAKQYNLTNHIRTHTGEKPFTCDHPGCSKSFATKGNLITHKRTHAGEKPFKCDHPGCGKSFATKGNLITHKRTHTGEKPFKCDHPGCNKSCAQKNDLTTHKKTHQPKSICDICGKVLRYVNAHKKKMHHNNNTKTNNRG